MPNSAEKNRQRRELRYWVFAPNHPNGGWHEAPVSPEMHGRFGTYSNWGCECPACNDANNRHSRTNRHRLRMALQRTLDSVIPTQRNRDN